MGDLAGAATSLATESTGTVLTPSQMLEIAGHEGYKPGKIGIRGHRKSSQKTSETNKISFTWNPSLPLKRTKLLTSGFNSQTIVYTKQHLKPEMRFFRKPPPYQTNFVRFIGLLQNVAMVPKRQNRRSSVAKRQWHTGSRQITEVKHRRAGLVPGWVTNPEHPVLQATVGALWTHGEAETSGQQSVLVSPP